jgi:hypothetical protein
MKDYFGTNEFWNKSKMSQPFLEKLNKFREELGAPMTITSSNNIEQIHVKTSDHYTGNAVDFITTASVTRVWNLALKHNFGGIGLYRNVQGSPYYHLGDGGRDKGDRWIGYLQKDGSIVYEAINDVSLKKYFGKV